MNKWFRLFIKKLRNTSVKMKVLGITIGLVLLMGIVSVFIIRELLIINLTDELKRRAVSISSDLSSRSSDLTILKDIYNLDKLLEHTKDHNLDIEYIFILDENGQDVLIHTLGRELEVSQALIQHNKIDNLQDQDHRIVSFPSEHGMIHDVVTPILGGDVGYVRVGLNEKQIKSTIHGLILTIILTTTIIAVIGIFISLLLTKIIYKDLMELIHVSKEVGKGNLTRKVKIESKDEIGLLGEEFNLMIDKLEEKDEENKTYLKELEMRNNGLLALNQLSVTLQDLNSFQDSLAYTAKKMKEELQLRFCYIEILLNDDKLIEVNDGIIKDCENCIINGADNCLNKGKYRFYTLKTTKNGAGKVVVCFENDPEEATVNFLHSFINQLSIITENALLWQELKFKEELRLKLLDRVISAQEEERKRIARELHDETSQSLASLMLGLTLLENSEIDSKLSDKINDLKKITENTIDEVHYLSWSLRPSALDDYGLLPAIKKYTDEFMQKYRIDVDIQVLGFEGIRLSSVIEVSIYRVIQEALTNAARHADAESISIIIKHVNNVVSLIIEDDGKGFNVSETAHRKLLKDHLGLKGMQERIESIGGQFLIESIKGMGTSIYVNDIKIGGIESEN